MKTKFLIFTLVTIVFPIVFICGCKEVTKREIKDVNVKIVDTYKRGYYVTMCGKTAIGHSAVYEIKVEYDGNRYVIDGRDTYYKFEDKVGKTVTGVLETTYYDDGTTVRIITKLK